MRRSILQQIFVMAVVCFSFDHALARGGEGHSIGFKAGVVTTDQEHLNTLITRANTREGGISTGQLSSAYEAAAFYAYRFSGSIYQLQLRPSYFYQSEEGTGASGAHEYSVTGFTVFPIFRLYPLENDFMKFFMQIGLGYGRANTDIKEGSFTAKGAGGAFGSLVGLGAEFCFTENHCIDFEGNYRYLTMERNIATSVNGTPGTGSLSQAGKDQELELDNTDLAARFTGLQFLMGYTMYF